MPTKVPQGKMLSRRHLCSSSSLFMPARRSVLKHFFVGTTCVPRRQAQAASIDIIDGEH